MAPPRTPTDTSTDANRQRHRRRGLVVVGGIVAAVVVAVGLWLTQPWLLFVDVVADESLPLAVDDGAPATDDGPTVVQEADEGGPGDGGTAPTPERTASDDSEQADGARSTGEGDRSSSDSSSDQPDASEEAVVAGPQALSTGTFVSRDHPTTGTVAIVLLEDGTRVLTIEGLDTDNGPDLFVYLDDGPADGPEGGFDDGVSLGRLRANQGDLVYEIPADLDLSTISSVAIWCDRFASLFGAADLVPAA